MALTKAVAGILGAAWMGVWRVALMTQALDGSVAKLVLAGEQSVMAGAKGSRMNDY